VLNLILYEIPPKNIFDNFTCPFYERINLSWPFIKTCTIRFKHSIASIRSFVQEENDAFKKQWINLKVLWWGFVYHCDWYSSRIIITYSSITILEDDLWKYINQINGNFCNRKDLFYLLNIIWNIIFFWKLINFSTFHTINPTCKLVDKTFYVRNLQICNMLYCFVK